jgi:hypothetical protein
MDLLAFLTSISAQLLFYAAWRGFEVRARNGAPESAAERKRRAWALSLGDFGGLLGRAVLVGPVLAPRAHAAVRHLHATALARAHRGLAEQTHAHAAVRREPALQAAAAGFGDDILVTSDGAWFEWQGGQLLYESVHNVQPESVLE